jgi:NADPH-dependent 2,4-dienoyl-CoA reductase/sulfur reductase-like enzyme
MRLLIIGGSDAGVSAAVRAQELRPDVEITVLLADAFPNYSICGLPFYISGETENWHQLAHRTEFPGIEILCNHRAEEVEPVHKIVRARSTAGLEVALKYDKLIIATGAKPAIPGISGIELAHPMHTMSNSFAVREKVTSGKVRKASIVGGGYIGVEMADALTHCGIEVELIGRADSVLPTVDPEIGRQISAELLKHGVAVRTGVAVHALRGTGSDIVLTGSNGFTSRADLVVWATGVIPASEIAVAAGVDMGSQQACKVSRRMETNLAEVYAAGDCVETWHRVLQRYSYLPLGTTAHKQGRVAGENAVGGDVEFGGAVGTQVVKVFDMAIARTGLLDREAVSGELSPLTVATEAYDHKAYYPGAEKLAIRVTGDLRTGKLIGAQIAGHWKAEVAKRIDVFATALFHGMKVEEINSLDLSYTPPLGSPWDAVQVAAQRWSTMQRQRLETNSE